MIWKSISKALAEENMLYVAILAMQEAKEPRSKKKRRQHGTGELNNGKSETRTADRVERI